MSLLLNAIYASLLILGSPWLLWRYLRWGKNRRGWAQRLLGWAPIRKSDRRCIWFHAVSVGEVNLLDPVLIRLQQLQPDIEVVISTTTETGYDLANQKYSDVPVFFFPLDFSWAVRNALRRIRPNLIVLTELELWPNFIRIVDQTQLSDHVADALGDPLAMGSPDGHQTTERNARRANIPIVVINGRLSETSFRGYRRVRRMMQSAFARISLVLAQNETYASRFRDLGIADHRVVVTGSVKFDGVQPDRCNPFTQELRRIAGVDSRQFVFLAGSTQFEEDIAAARVFKEILMTHPSARLILAPRHPERCGALDRALRELGLTSQRRSELKTHEISGWSDPAKVLVIDVIGELGAWWGVADVAFVGGSLGGNRGGQNMLEPAAYGIPVSFGPETENFREIVCQLLEADAATVVLNEREMQAFVAKAVDDPDWAAAMGARGRKVVLRHDGAADRSLNRMLELLPNGPPSQQNPSPGRMDAA